MKTLLVLFLIIRLTTSTDSETFLGYCKNPPEATKSLPGNMNLPQNYKIFGSMTNWVNMKTWLLEETSIEKKNVRILEKESGSVKETWIQKLSGGNGSVYLKDGKCNATAETPELFRVPRFDSIIGPDTSSISSIITGLQKESANLKGFYVNDHTWISCIKGTTDVILEIRLGSKQSSNPTFRSIRLAEVESVQSNHWSIEIDRYANPIGNEAIIPHGVYCTGLPTSPLKMNSPEEYAAILNYVDHSENTSEVVELFYSKFRQVFILSGENVNNVMEQRYPIGTDYILHDFKYGYEFTMKDGACTDFYRLPYNTNDIIMDYEGNHLLKWLEYILIPNYLSWSRYDEDDSDFINFRVLDSVTMRVWELQLTEDLHIHSYQQYDVNTQRLLFSMKVNEIPVEKSKLNVNPVQLSNCYDDGHGGSGTWIVPIQDKTIQDISRVGLTRLNDAVADSISKHVHPVIPYRVVVFYVENLDNGLSLILRLSEKSPVGPAKVPGYNLSMELPTDELFKLINAAIVAGKMPIELDTSDGNKEIWIPKAIRPFPPAAQVSRPSANIQLDVIFSIFCLLAGLLTGAAVVFVFRLPRRQSDDAKTLNRENVFTFIP